MIRGTAELLIGACDQLEGFVSAAGEGIYGTKSRGGAGCLSDELPPAAEIEAPLENPGSAREIAAT
jgi:hypothetical protein